MKLSEAIQHCVEQADLLEESAAGCDMTDKVEKEIACRSGKCAAEHRQLAEWLKELKERREKDVPDINVGKMSNKQWIDFLSKQFNISRTSAREMLHGMMCWKKKDNLKYQK